MLKGSRVVRGRDWAGRNQDGGKGGLGVVTGVNEKKGKVTVVWDTGHEYKYKAGKEGLYELSIYDNGPAGIQHLSVTCDSCREKPLEGLPWKCILCYNFDLCTTCYMGSKHSLAHPFLRFDTQKSVVVPVPSRQKSTRIKLHGILQGARVRRGLHWVWGHEDGGKGNVGKVTDIVKWEDNSYKGGVKVRWANGSTNTCRVGGGWRSDLLLVVESQTFYYFPDHLPAVDANHGGKVTLDVGDKVRIEVDATIVQKLQTEFLIWTYSLKQYLHVIGTVTRLRNRTADVRYPDAAEMVVIRNILTKTRDDLLGTRGIPLNNTEITSERPGWNIGVKRIFFQPRRKDCEKSKLSTVDLAPPLYWNPMGVENVMMCPLPCSGPEHEKVSRSFTSTMGKRTILKIQRIQNLNRWETFAVLKRQMSKRYGKENKGDEYLFHGTAPASVDRIIKQGIDFRLVKRALYGEGAYFARDAKVSDCYTMPDDSGHRFMFMVKVLVGKYTNGKIGMKKPPPIDLSDPDTLYDSVVDNSINPQIYVVFDNAQCYPEYLIEYR